MEYNKQLIMGGDRVAVLSSRRHRVPRSSVFLLQSNLKFRFGDCKWLIYDRAQWRRSCTVFIDFTGLGVFVITDKRLIVLQT